MKTLKKFLSDSIICGYVLIGVEFIFMISPFFIYYYTIYGMVLKKLFIFPLTSWLTAFFLPHIVLINTPFFVILSLAGPFLTAMGLGIFFVCAANIYIAKLKGQNTIITNGLYSFFLHPQYLGLAISGLGLLLIWPRFLTLIMYITMLFMYYLLSKDEENKMEKRFGDAYRNYKENIPRLLPELKLLYPFLNSDLKKSVMFSFLYIIVLIAAVGIGFSLREYSKSQLPIIYFKNIAAVALGPEDKNITMRILEKSLADERVFSYMSSDNLKGKATYMVYIMPFYESAKDKHAINAYGNAGSEKGVLNYKTDFIFRLRKFNDLFVLGPLSRFNTHKVAKMRRVVFCRVVDYKKKDVFPSEVFRITVARIPVIFAEFNIEKLQVVSLVEAPHWRKFVLPMPSF